MEAWIFNKKELQFITKLLVDKLETLPDNSELSVMELFTQTISSEWVNDIDEDGHPISGYRIKDIMLHDGTFLHDHLQWDFDNAVWIENINQSIALYQMFNTKAKSKGFIEDSAVRAGRRMGYPCHLSSIYRKKENIISSFAEVEEWFVDKGDDKKYYARELIETRHYQYRDSKDRTISYDRIKPLQLWRIPEGCLSGKTVVPNDYIRFVVIRGKCNVSLSRWDYVKLDSKRKASWYEFKDAVELKFNQSTVAIANRYEAKIPAPDNAWFQIANKGRSDLMLFVVDTSRFKTIEYEE